MKSVVTRLATATREGDIVGQISLVDVDKVYDNGYHAVNRLSLEVAEGELRRQHARPQRWLAFRGQKVAPHDFGVDGVAGGVSDHPQDEDPVAAVPSQRSKNLCVGGGHPGNLPRQLRGEPIRGR